MNLPLQKIFAQRLAQARAMRGFSLRALEEAIGGKVSHNALAKYENEEMMPGSDVLVALSEALGQPGDFFFRPFHREIQQMRFRKKAKFPVSRQKAVREMALDFVERYDEAEELADDRRVFEPPFKESADTVRTLKDGEMFADKLRQKWKLGEEPLSNLHETMENQGIKVLEIPSESSEFDGLSANTDVGPVVLLGSWLKRNIPRKRMTEAHELGHIVIPFPEGFDEKEEEHIVAAFAGAFLLPKKPFVAAFGARRSKVFISELKGIKTRFGVSYMGIMKRAQGLGLITDSTYKSFCFMASKWGWRTNGESGDTLWRGTEEGMRFHQLVYRLIAEERITLSKGAALRGIPMAKLRSEMDGMEKVTE